MDADRLEAEARPVHRTLASVAALALVAACQQILGLEEGRPPPDAGPTSSASAGGGGAATGSGAAGAGGPQGSGGSAGEGGATSSGAGAGGGGGGAPVDPPVGVVVGWLQDLVAGQQKPPGWWSCDGTKVGLPASPLDGTLVPDLNDHFFLRGGATSGATGGSETHTHTIATKADSPGGTGTKLLSSSTTAVATHLPPYYEVVGLLRALPGVDWPLGSVVGWLGGFGAVPALPAGWVRLDGQLLQDAASPYDGATLPDLNAATSPEGRFLRFASASGGQGGAASHAHSIGTVADGSVDGSDSTTAEGTTSTDASLPPYYTASWIMRASDTGPGVPPIGAVLPWLPALTGVPAALPAGYLVCAGQRIADPASPLDGEVLPDLTTGVFLRGGAKAGATGGSATHSHTQPTHKKESPPGSGGYVFSNPYTSVASLPPYYEVVFIARVK
jgi:hypothetical protein